MKCMNLILAVSLLLTSSLALADLQCGGYRLHAAKNGWTEINGEQATSQKIKFLGQKDDNNYGFEFVKRNGKSFLNVQLLQNNMDAPKIIGSFPCKKVSG